VKRGDVVRTFAEYMALPDGTDLLGINGVDWRKKGELDEESFDRLPALVRVVGAVEPEWLRTAALAAASALPLASLVDEAWGRAAKAAVAAADKARGIVNSREEFDALCAQVGVKIVEPGGTTWTTTGEVGNANTGPKSWPCLIVNHS